MYVIFIQFKVKLLDGVTSSAKRNPDAHSLRFIPKKEDSLLHVAFMKPKELVDKHGTSGPKEC